MRWICIDQKNSFHIDDEGLERYFFLDKLRHCDYENGGVGDYVILSCPLTGKQTKNTQELSEGEFQNTMENQR